jgi:hypothetical protein
MAYLADLLPKPGCREAGDAGGRLYWQQTVPSPEPPATELASVRTLLNLTLQSTADGHALLHSPVPSLLFGCFHPFNLFMLILITLAAVAAAYVVSFRSLNRLFFVDLLGSWRSRKLPGLSALLSEAYPARMLVTHYHDDALQELKDSPVCAELKGSALPAATTRLWFVPDTEIWLTKHDGLAVLRQVLPRVGEPGMPRLVLFAEPGLLEALPEEQRREVAGLLSQFADVDLRRGGFAGGEPNEVTLESWWLESSPDERRVLGQLAIDGYVNPHPANRTIIEALAARGLLDERTFTIYSEQFARLVAQRIQDSDTKAWEAADKGSAWNALRLPLSTGVASLLAALTVSKPELGVASALVPTLATGLPSIVKLIIEMATPKAPG